MTTSSTFTTARRWKAVWWYYLSDWEVRSRPKRRGPFLNALRFGQSTVTDFRKGHDVVEFDHAAFADVAAVLANAAQAAADTIITVADHGS
jgi:hypothetical protein